MVQARTVGQVIAGEAVSGTPEERWADMVAIASVIANRAAALGVSPQQVIANTNEFNAYNRAMPPGTADLTDMAQEAMNYVEENGPVNNATFYATPAATDNLPSGLLAETATTGHQYFSDPQNRAIGTSLGYRQPNEFSYAANPENVPTPDQPSLMGAAGDIGQGWSINGVAPALGPTVEGWSAMAAAEPMAAPVGSITANGLLGSNPDLAASAAVPGGLLSSPSISQADIQRALSNPTGMNELDPSFTAGLMGPNNPVVPNAVETTSYTDPATAVATGINSPEHKQIQAMAEAQLAATRAVQPGMSVPASGLLASNPALEASATVPGMQSSFAATPSVTPAEQAINSIATPGMSPQQIGGYQQAANTMAQAGSMAAPQSLSLGDKLKAAVNPGTAVGGLLGAATMGPIGGLLGGLLGNSINNNSFSGLLGGAPTMTNVGVGPAAAYGVYGGGLAPGSTATASDGSTVSAQAGGDTARTNGFGVTDVSNSYGGYASDFSGWY